MNEENVQSKIPNTDAAIQSIMDALAIANSIDENDPNQHALIRAIQKHREMILHNATVAYVKNPNNPKLLDALNSLITALEKSVRDDRKEKAKDKDREENRASFNQMVEALKNIKESTIVLPEWSPELILLDPSVSIQEHIGELNFKPDELVQGNFNVDFDGNKV